MGDELESVAIICDIFGSLESMVRLLLVDRMSAVGEVGDVFGATGIAQYTHGQ